MFGLAPPYPPFSVPRTFLKTKYNISLQYQLEAQFFEAIASQKTKKELIIFYSSNKGLQKKIPSVKRYLPSRHLSQ